VSDALAAVASLVEEMEPGFGLITCCPGQEHLVALALDVRGAVVVTPEEVPQVGQARILLVTGAPCEQTLREWNGRRDHSTELGLRVVLIVDRRGAGTVRRFAPDIADALVLDEVAPYQPVEVDEAAALHAYTAWLRERYGRLDLRGFARSERENVSWTVEEVFVEPAVKGKRSFRLATLSIDNGGVDLVFTSRLSWCLPEPNPLRHVLLGHPGSGKTFALRWLALAEEPRTSAWGDAATLPLLAPLSVYARDGLNRDLLDHIRDQLLAEGLALGHCLEPLARAGRACFLLDGLDEGGDAATRKVVVRAVQALAARFPTCPFLVTSRITGFDEAPLSWPRLQVQPFNDDQVRAFLTGWLHLYAEERLGHTAEVRNRGTAEGRRLAEDVLRHPQVAALARSPLLLTVIAMVHRAGLRLPDHRVELYEHATRILVERWNRLRGLASDGRASPIKSADAVRMFGPVALATLQRGAIATIGEAELRASMDAALAGGRLRSVVDTDEALRIFKDDLGLLVEQGPGVWFFLHLTLAECYASWELVRSGGLEKLAADPVVAFQAHYREVLLLAAGTLGILRADDERLARLVHALIDSARRRPGRPSSVVPSLLAGLLADDPALSVETGQTLVDALVPTWWFDRAYGAKGYAAVAEEAAGTLGPRILDGRHGTSLRSRLEQMVATRPSGHLLETLGKARAEVFGAIVALLERAEVGPSGLILAALARVGPPREAARLAWTLRGEVSEDRLVLRVPAALDDALQAAEPRLALVVELIDRTAGPLVPDEASSWPPTLMTWRNRRPTQLSRDSFVHIADDGAWRVLEAPSPAPKKGRTLVPGPVRARPKLPPHPRD